MKLTQKWVLDLKPVEPFLPFANPTFENPRFDDASYRVLVVRLTPFRDVDRSLPHLFLFQEIRRALPDGFVDLAFFPSADQRAQFEEDGIPFLVGIHSLRSADEFDLLLISNAYTLELINLPYLLIRSGIPLFSSQRGPEWPILVLGGSNAMAAQAVVRQDGDSLVDGIFFGEGEGWVGELVRLLRSHGKMGRRELLDRAVREVPGFWAAGSLAPGTKTVRCEPDVRYLPFEYPILNSPEVHTASLQITYGCPAFCAFCFEGYDRKPYRELPLPDVLAAARWIKQTQGVEELNLYSFNFNTHAGIFEMLVELHRVFDRVSFKSQRLDILQHAGTLLEAEVAADKRNFTLGVEGISQRQRAWLHKSLSAEEIAALLERLFPLKIRTVKLFYVLTGHETGDDVAEFRRFVRWLKEVRRSKNRRVRVVFSFGLLIRMPFTPLRYDRLFLEEEPWRPLIGQVKSVCETNGFEFRLAFDWPDYCTSQVLALGGYWLVEPVVALARRGYCFDTALPAEYWDALRGWMVDAGHWTDAFLGEKDSDYPFALDFVESNVPAGFLYRQYQQAQSGEDPGYCLGDQEQPGRCLGCGACVDEEQREAIIHHRIRQPERGPYLAHLQKVVANKRRLAPVYFILRVDSSLAGVLPECLNAFVFKEILSRHPDMVDNLLSVRERLFTVGPNAGHFPMVFGETVFAFKVWDVTLLEAALEAGVFPKNLASGPRFVDIVGPARGFTPGTFTRLHLDLYLPADLFPKPRVHLEHHLRDAYLRYSLRREGNRLTFDLPSKALKKKILFGGDIEIRQGQDGEDGFFARLTIGPKFDLAALMATFGSPHLARHARARVSGIEW